MIRIICCILIFTSSFCNSIEYTVSLLDIETDPNGSYEVTSINDKGQILGMYRDNKSLNPKTYLYDPKSGLSFIDSKNWSTSPIKINNAGQVLGFGHKPFLWCKTFGFRYLEIFNSLHITLTDLNDLGQVIGTYLPIEDLIIGPSTYRSFLWDYGVITDLGIDSEFAQKIIEKGFYITQLDVQSINNKGELVGYFGYGKFNKKKKKYVTIGYEAFFWDGDMHILPLPEGLNCNPIIKINNKSSIIVSTRQYYSENRDFKTYLFDCMGSLFEIIGFYGIELNDNDVILGHIEAQEFTFGDIEVPAIWSNNNINKISDLLGVKNLNELGPMYSDIYSIEAIRIIKDINNMGQIPCMGSIWGDSYPCLLAPLK